MSLSLLAYFVYAVICIPLCARITRKSGMTQWWAWFFSITFSFIIAWWMVDFSGQPGGTKKYTNKGTVWGNIKTAGCFLLGAYLLYSASIGYSKDVLPAVIFASGFIGNGIYLLSDADIIYAKDSDNEQEN